MLATPAADLSDVAKQMPEQFAVEDKFDGIRAQAHIAPDTGETSLHGRVDNGRRIALFSRTLDEITGAFPDLLSALSALIPSDNDAGLILDGEIVPVRGEQILPFQELQKRLGRKVPTEEIMQAVPVAFFAYDALFGDKRVLIEEAFSTRRAILDNLPFDNDRTRLAPSHVFEEVAKLDDEFDAARNRGNEGLMVKDPRSKYKPGRRGREWLKIKRAIATLDVVVTAVEVGNGRRSKVLSDYTFAVRAGETDSTLLNVGKAYSGLTDAEIAEMSEWFRAHTLQEFAHGKVRVVEPQIVIEVTFDRVQPSARHKSGFALRFPRIVRLRPDKPVAEIDTLETVRRLAEAGS
jgi:DNA ligase-1